MPCDGSTPIGGKGDAILANSFWRLAASCYSTCRDWKRSRSPMVSKPGLSQPWRWLERAGAPTSRRRRRSSRINSATHRTPWTWRAGCLPTALCAPTCWTRRRLCGNWRKPRARLHWHDISISLACPNGGTRMPGGHGSSSSYRNPTWPRPSCPQASERGATRSPDRSPRFSPIWRWWSSGPWPTGLRSWRPFVSSTAGTNATWAKR